MPPRATERPQGYSRDERISLWRRVRPLAMAACIRKNSVRIEGHTYGDEEVIRREKAYVLEGRAPELGGEDEIRGLAISGGGIRSAYSFLPGMTSIRWEAIGQRVISPAVLTSTIR